jgi:hypothetical protein
MRRTELLPVLCRVAAGIPQQLAKPWSQKVAAGIAALAVGVGLASAATATAAPAATAASAGTATAPAATATVPCRSYPRPGTTADARVPALVLAEYGVLRRPRRPADRIAVRRLGRLPESGILVAGIRMLGTVPGGGHAYLVPSLHLLAAPMRPVRCVPSAQRARQASLLATLRHEYARQGLCSVVVYRRGTVDNCGAAPGTVGALLRGPGAPAFGIAPDGIDSVTVIFRGRQQPARLALVHGNFWLLSSTGGPAPAACGLDWLAPGQTVLRTVRRCTPDTS